MMKIVNTFIVGQPRSGTTSIYNYLRRVSGIYLPDQKQLYHFEKDYNNFRKLHGVDWNKMRNYYNYDLDSYHYHFRKRKDEKIVMDITPSYLFSSSAHKEIVNYNPDAKIIMLFRKPIDYLQSMHRLLVINSIDFVDDFNKSFKLSAKRRFEHIEQATSEKSEICDYESRVAYTAQLSRYYSVFPRRNIKVMFYEDFADNHAEFLAKMLAFLELDNDKDIFSDELHDNSSKAVQYEWLNQLRGKNFLSPVYKFVPAPVRKFVGGLVRNIALRPYETDSIPIDTEILDICANEEKLFLDFLENKNLIDDVERVRLMWG